LFPLDKSFSSFLHIKVLVSISSFLHIKHVEVSDVFILVLESYKPVPARVDGVVGFASVVCSFNLRARVYTEGPQFEPGSTHFSVSFLLCSVSFCSSS